MMRTIVIGAAGRMGRMLVAQIHRDPEMTLVGAIEYSGSPELGNDVGLVAGIAPIGVPITADISALVGDADVVIDFSLPESTMAAVGPAVDKGCCVVIGTTGFSDEQKQNIRKLAEGGGRILLAPNMSVGVNLLFHLCAKIVPALGPDYDLEVVEVHHNRKKDAPSGTAVRLGEILAQAAGLDYSTDTVHGRCGNVGARPKRQIGMHAIRGGDVVGDHTVLFAADGERVELTHRASSREAFTQGAIRAAKFLIAAKPGLYDMQDVLGLKA